MFNVITKKIIPLILFLMIILAGCSLSDKEESAVTTDATNPLVPVAFPGQTGEVKTGYYHGQEVSYQLINGKCVVMDDIVLDPSDLEEAPSKGAGRSSSAAYWPSRNVVFRYNSSFTNTANATTAINYYRDLGFNFIERTTQSNYIDFIFISNSDGFYSDSIGMKGGRQIIHLANGYSVGTAVHEIGHALGLYHEQSRTDRDSNLIVNWTNIVTDKRGNFRTYTERGSDGFNYHNFDWQSLMLYPPFTGFEINSSIPSMTRADGTTYTVQSVRLSAGDIETLNTMYPQSYIAWTDVVARDSAKIDIVRANASGYIHTAATDEYVQSGAWRGWWSIQNGRTAAGGQVSIVSRHPKKLDVFTVGTNGRVYTAAWDQNVSSGAWRGWWTIGSLTCQQGAYISAVNRTSTSLDVFAIGSDGGIYTAAWDQNVSGGAWRGWWRINNGVASCGTEISAVTRATNMLDVFVVGNDGNIYTAAWDANVSNGAWRGWWNLGAPSGQRFATVKAVTSASNRIHVLGVCINGRIASNEWDGANGGWSGWKYVNTLTAQPGAKVYPVSRGTGYVDIFVLGDNQNVYTAAWKYGTNARNTYGSWVNLGSGITPGTQVSAVSKSLSELDVFAVSGNGTAVWTRSWTSSAGWGAWKMLP